MDRSMSLREKFNVIHHFPRNESHSIPQNTTEGTGHRFWLGHNAGAKGRPNCETVLCFLQERQGRAEQTAENWLV